MGFFMAKKNHRGTNRSHPLNQNQGVFSMDNVFSDVLGIDEEYFWSVDGLSQKNSATFLWMTFCTQNFLRWDGFVVCLGTISKIKNILQPKSHCNKPFFEGGFKLKDLGCMSQSNWNIPFCESYLSDRRDNIWAYRGKARDKQARDRSTPQSSTWSSPACDGYAWSVNRHPKAV